MYDHLLSNLLLKKPNLYCNPLSDNEIDSPSLTESAVLIPLVPRSTGVHLILTQRASYLRHHPNQMSFPGGKKEMNDHSLVDTAIRETHEEIGILPEQITPLAQLNTLVTLTHYKITPIVALIEPNYRVKINHEEVSRLFEIPIDKLLNKRNRFNQTFITKDQRKHEVIFIPYKDKLIWGVTADIIQSLDYSQSQVEYL